MIKVRNILYVIGLLIVMLGLTMIIPFTFDLLTNTADAHVFGLSSFTSLFVGGLLFLSCRPIGTLSLSVREVFLLTSLTWLFLGAFASIPFSIGVTNLSTVDSFFEAISGLTTTGATVITSLGKQPASLLVWRALLQWLGGIGIIVMALTILPFLRIGGMQLFHSEFSDRSEKVLPRVTQIATAIFSTYILLTLMCVLLLWVSDMTFVDALCYGLSTISTGGFSPHDSSVANFIDQPAVMLIIMVFMIIGGSTLILFVRFGRGESGVLFKDAQVRAYLLFIISTIAFVFLWRLSSEQHLEFETLLTNCFSLVSIITTTGFSAENYGSWGTFGTMLFFFLMFVGGCTGSTSGGIKIFRFQVLLAVVISHLKHLRHPHGIFVATYNNKPITESVFSSVLTFFSLYGVIFSFIAITLALTGLDFLTSLSAAVASLSNIGPGLGEIIGPSSTYQPLDTIPKIIIMTGMILGRLELLTLIVIFSPYFWRR